MKISQCKLISIDWKSEDLLPYYISDVQNKFIQEYESNNMRFRKSVRARFSPKWLTLESNLNGLSDIPMLMQFGTKFHHDWINVVGVMTKSIFYHVEL